MKRIYLAVLCFGLSAALALAASVHSHWDRVPEKEHTRANPVAGQADAIAAGALAYKDHCAQCHRADARGDGRKHPSLRSGDLRGVSDGDLEWFLRQGDLAHGMPSWSSLPTEQRWEIVAYLRSIQ